VAQYLDTGINKSDNYVVYTYDSDSGKLIYEQGKSVSSGFGYPLSNDISSWTVDTIPGDGSDKSHQLGSMIYQTYWIIFTNTGDDAGTYEIHTYWLEYDYS
jgi:hypothetical protein